MKYNFDREVDRVSTNDLKWNRSAVEAQLHCKIMENMVPMWIADTDFACPPVIVEAIKARAEKEIYGYCTPFQSFYSAVMFWNKKRFGLELDPQEILISPSVVASINVAIRTFSQEGDGVIIQTPVYDPFSSIVKNSGRQVVTNQLLCTKGRYEMNLAELEMLAQKPENKVMILCSPHNPVGRVWTKEELIAVADICGKNGVMLVSDEIHSDIVFNNAPHYPLLGLKKEYSKFVIQLGAPGKTFNIAGLKCSMAYIKDEEVRKKFANTQIAMSLDVKNTFGIEGVIAAYTLEGEEWMNQELEYMQGNVEYVMDFVKTQMPDVSMAPPQGTFLCWLDLSRLGLSDEEIMKKVVLEAGVICVPGPWFGKGGEQHLRLNIGCTRKNLTAAMERIRDSLYAK